jgi:hypothetical protein
MKRFTIPVVFTDYTVTLSKKQPKVEKEPVLGYCYYNKRQIAVWDIPTNNELVRATLWHEWFHAALRELGRGELAQDESLVDGLANALMRVRLELPDL